LNERCRGKRRRGAQCQSSGLHDARMSMARV
jgi:hypothetical protein